MDLDGNTWARQLVGSDSTRTRYDVFGANGAWLGSLTLPISVAEWGGQFFARGRIYAAVEDGEGRPAVVRVDVVRR